MKKYLLSTYLVLFSFLLTMAAPVDEQSARRIASDFLRSKMPQVTRAASGELSRAITGVADGDSAGIYVFNCDGGFVVISADDELPSVLAYGLKNSYDAQTAPPAMQAMLEAYNHAVNSSVKTRAAVPTHADISPLIKTQWNQNTPYNNNCPVESGVNCPTGCVATATAQIMYYHKWPETFNWDAMKTTYSSDDTGEAVDAVAKLMADVGEKVYMQYGSESSSAYEYDACEALRIQYGYAETTNYIERTCYTAKGWDEVIYNELAANRPVFYVGRSASSGQGIVGHAFILDGYQAKDGVGYFHVNWGWGGSSDDYFLISVLNPEMQYTGGNAGSSGYSFDQSALVGVEKGASVAGKSMRLFVNSCTIKSDKGTYTRNSASENFPGIQLMMYIYNVVQPKEVRHYDLGYALYQNDKLVAMIDSTSVNYNFDYFKGTSYITASLAFGKGLDDGTYQLRAMSRETGKSLWQQALNATCRYIELTINGNQMTTKAYGSFEDPSVSSFTINSVTVSENCEVGKPITITVNVTDKNKTNNAPLFLYGNASLEQGADKFQLLTGGGTNLEAGETGDVVLEYTPQRAGNFVFYLSGDRTELTDSLYRFEAKVTGVALIMEMEVEGAVVKGAAPCEVPGTALKGKIVLTNYGSEPYNDKVGILPCELIGNTLNTIGQSVTTDCNIAIGDSQEVSFNFRNLTLNSTYIILVRIPDGDDVKYLNWEDDGSIKYIYIFTMIEDTAIKDIQLDSPDADVYDMRGVRLGKASELKSLPKGVYIINKKKVVNK
jgi:hypothetical protein